MRTQVYHNILAILILTFTFSINKSGHLHIFQLGCPLQSYYLIKW